MTSPTEAYIRNLFAIQRLGNGINADVEAMLQDLFDDLVGQVAKVNPTAVQSASYRAARVRRLTDWIQENANATYAELTREVRTALAEVGVQQARWQAAHIVDTIEYGGGVVEAALKPGHVTLNTWKAIVDTDFVQGRTMAEWFASQESGVVEKVQAQIRMGVSRGESIDELTQRIRGRSTGSYRTVTLKSGETRRLYQFEGGVLPTTTRNAQSVVRTAVNEISNTAHFSVYEANSDIVTGYRYLATLDSDTTLICRSLHGEVWALDDPDGKRPPQHWGCRSTTQPVIEGLEDIHEAGMVAAEGGPVKGGTTQEQWLRMQPREKLDEILGKRRADLFRSGKVDLKDMVRSDGSIVRVAELEAGA
jgi:SPP1 gp7 family putative phage head morphogenesis protein